LGTRRVKRLRKGEYALERADVELAMPLGATHLAITDFLRSVPTARTGDIITATGLSRPAINSALGQLIYAKEKIAWPCEAPPYMHWHRRLGDRGVLTAAITLKSGKVFYGTLDTDPERAKARIVPLIKKLIRAGELDRHSDIAELYLHRTITEDELDPTYMYWMAARGVWRSKIPLKNGKNFNRALDADRERAVVLIVSFITALVAAGQLDRDHPAAKLYLDRAITGAELDHDPKILNADRGAQSVKAPACMTWKDGIPIDDGTWHPPDKSRTRVLYSQIRLVNGSVLQANLRTDDPKVAAKRLREHVLKAMAEGNLRPNSKAAKIYGGAEAISRVTAPAVGSAKTGRAKRPSGRKPKWMNSDGVVPPDARVFYEVVTAARAPGGPINAAIKKAYDQIPPSIKISSFERPLSIRTLTNRFLDLQRVLMRNSGQ
jgi:hypothetical protein